MTEKKSVLGRFGKRLKESAGEVAASAKEKASPHLETAADLAKDQSAKAGNVAKEKAGAALAGVSAAAQQATEAARTGAEATALKTAKRAVTAADSRIKGWEDRVTSRPAVEDMPGTPDSEVENTELSGKASSEDQLAGQPDCLDDNEPN